MKPKAPDIVIRAFRDLDIVFFGENLSGNCIVWVSGISHAVLIFELLLRFGSRLEYTSFSEVFKHSCSYLYKLSLTHESLIVER